MLTKNAGFATSLPRTMFQIWWNVEAVGFPIKTDSSNAQDSILSFIRKGNNPDEQILCILNFTPMTHFNHFSGVPESGFWEEVFNSDSETYGGSNQGNLGGVWSQNVTWDNYLQRIEITVPPLAALFFQLKKKT